MRAYELLASAYLRLHPHHALRLTWRQWRRYREQLDAIVQAGQRGGDG